MVDGDDHAEPGVRGKNQMSWRDEMYARSPEYLNTAASFVVDVVQEKTLDLGFTISFVSRSPLPLQHAEYLILSILLLSSVLYT